MTKKKKKRASTHWKLVLSIITVNDAFACYVKYAAAEEGLTSLFLLLQVTDTTAYEYRYIIVMITTLHAIIYLLQYQYYSASLW